jgi:uncharacterized membrane protein (UPF0127 family)
MTALRDVTTGEVLAMDVRVAANPWARFRGLMLRGALLPGEALDIRGDASIHMMFMRFPIDAVFYDRDLRVTKVVRRLRPWLGFAFGGRGARGVVEMASGAAETVEPGHQLEWAA